jgi:hypothetical protein
VGTDCYRRTYPKRLVWRHPHKALEVVFLLVPKGEEGDHDPATYYIMRNKVWSELYETFVKEQRESGKPLKYPEWKRRENNRWPALDIYVVDAARFASWMHPTMGKLPTTGQWDKASGYSAGAHPLCGPFQGMWSFEEGAKNPDVAVRRREPMEVGTATGEVSPKFLCEDMAGNGREWTRNIQRDNRPVNPEDDFEVLKTIPVHVRGHDHKEDRPFLFDRHQRGMLGSNPYGECTGMGFRIVLEPSAVASGK